MIEQAVILVGGFGTRLEPATRKISKPMLLVGGKPFLFYLVWNLNRLGVKNILFLTGHCAEHISEYFGDGFLHGIKITYSHETIPLGTAGALKLAAHHLDEQYLVMNGDSLFDINYIEAGDFLCSLPHAIAAIALYQMSDVTRYGQVMIDGTRVNGFCEKEKVSQSGYINSGVYAMNRQVLDFIPEGNFSLEIDLFPQLAREGLLVAKEWDGYFIDIGTPDDFERAQLELPEWMKKKQLSSP